MTFPTSLEPKKRHDYGAWVAGRPMIATANKEFAAETAKPYFPPCRQTSTSALTALGGGRPSACGRDDRTPYVHA
jgi:hypothetical protein